MSLTKTVNSALDLAILFHDTYERLAPQFGYETRPETRKFSPSSPNGQLMRAVCEELLRALRPPVEPPAPPVQVPDVSADLSQYGFAFVLVRPGGATYRIDPLDVTLQKFPDQPENR